MVKPGKQTKESILYLTIIAAGLLLTFSVLLFICSIIIGAPLFIFAVLMGMLGLH